MYAKKTSTPALPAVSTQLVGGQGQVHALVCVMLAGDVNAIRAQILRQAGAFKALIDVICVT